MKKKFFFTAALFVIAAVFSDSLQAASDIFSVNFYSYGKSGSLSDSQWLN